MKAQNIGTGQRLKNSLVVLL